MPANTGEAGAILRVACIAGTPAPTEEARRACGLCGTCHFRKK